MRHAGDFGDGRLVVYEGDPNDTEAFIAGLAYEVEQ